MKSGPRRAGGPLLPCRSRRNRPVAIAFRQPPAATTSECCRIRFWPASRSFRARASRRFSTPRWELWSLATYHVAFAAGVRAPGGLGPVMVPSHYTPARRRKSCDSNRITAPSGNRRVSLAVGLEVVCGVIRRARLAASSRKPTRFVHSRSPKQSRCYQESTYVILAARQIALSMLHGSAHLSPLTKPNRQRAAQFL